MHNYIGLAIVFVACVIVAGVKSLRLEVGELEKHPKLTTQNIVALLKLQQILQSNLLILNVLLLLLVSITSFDIFQILGLAFIWLAVVHVLAANARLKAHAKRLANRHLKLLVTLATGLEPALNLLDSTRLIVTLKPRRFTSKAELVDAMDQSTSVFTDDEKQQVRKILQ